MISLILLRSDNRRLARWATRLHEVDGAGRICHSLILYKILIILDNNCLKTLSHVTISSAISLTMASSTMEFNEIVDDEPATRNGFVNDADVK